MRPRSRARAMTSGSGADSIMFLSCASFSRNVSCNRSFWATKRCETMMPVMRSAASLGPSARHGDGALDLLEVGVGSVERVAREVEDRVLLRAAPQPLGADERAPRGEELDAIDRGGEEREDDRHEQPDDEHHPLG